MTAGPASEPSLGFLLADVVRLMRADFRTRATGLKLTPALAKLLYYVARRPGCRQAELAAFLELTPVTLGRMIGRLARQGYVRRAHDPADRRARRIHLAPPAAGVLSRMDRAIALTSARATRGLRAADHQSLLGLLSRLRTNLGGAGD